MKTYLFLFTISLGFLASCGSDDPSTEDFNNQFSFTIDGTAYNYSDFEISHDLIPNERVFIRKDDGDLTFTSNIRFSLGVGTHPMSSGSAAFFYADLPAAAFFCLDETQCTMNIMEIDTINRRLSATFTALGESLAVSETINVTNGVIKVNY